MVESQLPLMGVHYAQHPVEEGSIEASASRLRWKITRVVMAEVDGCDGSPSIFGIGKSL